MNIQPLLDFVNDYGVRPGGQNKGELLVHHPGSLKLGSDHILIIPLHYTVCVCLGGEDHESKEKLEEDGGEHRVVFTKMSCFNSIQICTMYAYIY